MKDEPTTHDTETTMTNTIQHNAAIARDIDGLIEEIEAHHQAEIAANQVDFERRRQLSLWVADLIDRVAEARGVSRDGEAWKIGRAYLEARGVEMRTRFEEGMAVLATIQDEEERRLAGLYFTLRGGPDDLVETMQILRGNDGDVAKRQWDRSVARTAWGWFGECDE